MEIGSRYTDKEWTQKLMTLSDFIDQHILQQVCILNLSCRLCVYVRVLSRKKVWREAIWLNIISFSKYIHTSEYFSVKNHNFSSFFRFPSSGRT